MDERKTYKWPYRFRTWGFSLCCVFVVLLGGYIAANNRAWGWNIENISAFLVVIGAVVIFALKKLIWRCPSCGHSFEMGGTHSRIKSSNLDSCPKCHASFS